MVEQLAIEDIILKNQDKWEKRHFDADTIVFYAGHVPFCILYIVEGSGVMMSKGRRVDIMKEGIPYFYHELINERALRKNVIIKAGSTVLMVDRYQLGIL